LNNCKREKIGTKLVQINDVFLSQIKYNTIGYFSAFRQKTTSGILFSSCE